MRLSLLCISIFLTISTFAQQNNCDQFREGYFKIEDSIYGVSLIHRLGNKQIEYAALSKMKMELSVDWSESDCVYSLVLDKILENPYEIKMPDSSSSSYISLDSLIVENEVQRITKEEYHKEMDRQTAISKDLTIDDPKFKKEVAQSVCTCFSEDNKPEISRTYFSNCIMQGVLEHKEKFMTIALRDTTGIDPEKLGEQIGQKVVISIQKDLIYDCDDYFHFLNAMKQIGVEKRKATASEKITDSLSSLIEKNQELSLYRQRAANYLALNDLKKAENDIDICFVFDPNDIQTKLLYASLLEEQKEYLKATDIISEISEVTRNPFLSVFAELLKRKAKE